MCRFVFQLFLGLLLGSCSGEKTAVIEWLSEDATLSAPRGAPVSFRDGSVLMGSTVERVGVDQVAATVWWKPGPRSKGTFFRVRLFPTNGGKSIDVDVPPMGEIQKGVLKYTATFSNSRFETDDRFWVAIRLMEAESDVVKAPPFPSHWIPIGVIHPKGFELQSHPHEDGEWTTLAAGGDANIGRRLNGISNATGFHYSLGSLEPLQNADLSFVNLECVVSEAGQEQFPKGESVPHYYRARQEQINVLTSVGVDVVGTANNHAGDYGPAGLADQFRILREAGIVAVGSGVGLDEACAPKFVNHDGLTVGFVSLDTTWSLYEAKNGQPGTCFVDPSDTGSAMRVLAPHIEAARKGADVVLAAVHWGKNKKSRPSKSTRRLAAAIIGAGVDGILGSSAHVLQGVELIDGRPVLYDMGNVLFDNHAEGEMARGGLFVLDLDKSGVRQVRMHPLELGYGVTEVAVGNSAARTLSRFQQLSNELGTGVE